MFTLHVETKNTRLVRLIGQALVEYSAGDETEQPKGEAAPFERVPAPETEQPKGDTIQPPGVVEVPQPEAAPPIAGSGLDSNGVAHNPDFCTAMTSKAPFKQDGTWKKKRGISPDDFKQWYSGEHVKVPMNPSPDPAAVDVKAAFGGEPSPPEPEQTAPADPGALMRWVSEQVAAERFTQQDVTAAYAVVGIELQNMFADTPEQVAGYVVQLHGILSQNG